jgi:ADP-heptose:LPS heptosyltransferase
MKIINPINILVQRRSAIGDVIMATGVVRELRKRYGRTCNIDVVTESIEVFRNNPHVRNIIPFVAQPDARAYDIYINLDDAYELNPQNHYVDSYFYRAFGDAHLTMDKHLELFPDDADRALVDSDIAKFGQQFVVVHMRNWHWSSKNISQDIWFEVWARLFEQRTDVTVVTVGGSTDYTVADHPLFFDARDRYNVQQIKHLCDQAQCFVGIDSAPYHAAAASSTHIVSLHTHLLPERIVPHRRMDIMWNATPVKTLEPCIGCNDEQAVPVRQVMCKYGTCRCANSFDPDQIVAAIVAQLR